MATMKKAAVIIDKWKLPVFERMLKEEGFDFKIVAKWPPECLTLRVDTKTIAELAPVIKKINETAKESKNARR